METHVTDFIAAYNYARRLKTLNGLTPFEYICKIWTTEPERFSVDPTHHTLGLNTWYAMRLIGFLACGFVEFVAFRLGEETACISGGLLQVIVGADGGSPDQDHGLCKGHPGGAKIRALQGKNKNHAPTAFMIVTALGLLRDDRLSRMITQPDRRVRADCVFV